MAELQFILPDSIGDFAGAQVASGRFKTLSDYMVALVSADEQAQRIIGQLNENPKLAALLEEGLNSGHGRHWSDTVLRELKQQVVERAAGKNT